MVYLPSITGVVPFEIDIQTSRILRSSLEHTYPVSIGEKSVSLGKSQFERQEVGSTMRVITMDGSFRVKKVINFRRVPSQESMVKSKSDKPMDAQRVTSDRLTDAFWNSDWSETGGNKTNGQDKGSRKRRTDDGCLSRLMLGQMTDHKGGWIVALKW